MLVFWSYPMLLLIVLGTFRHQQRLARFGADRSWSSSWGRSGRQPRGWADGLVDEFGSLAAVLAASPDALARTVDDDGAGAPAAARCGRRCCRR